MPANGWMLHFYGGGSPFAAVDDVVPGFSDVADRARRNGAKDGTPFFLDPSGRADALVNAYWRDPVVRARARLTQRRYASSLKVWLDFLHVIGVRWDVASRNELAAFKEWRMSAEDNEKSVVSNSFRIDQAAIHGFYVWAADQHGIANPVGVRSIAATRHAPERTKLESTPSGARLADVKWLTPQAFRVWRDIGLKGFTSVGLPRDTWKGQTEDRDVAFAESLFGTGLRIGELSSLLTVEFPTPRQGGLLRGRVASSCAKGGSGRVFWTRRRVSQLVRFYCEEGGRPAAVARAQQAQLYEQITDRWIVEKIRQDRCLVLRKSRSAERQTVSLDGLAPATRMKLYREGEDGLEPLWLWLNDDGSPRPKHSWYKTFGRANRRVARVMEQAGEAPLWCRPHMLRHSFALRWYCIATFVAWQRTHLLTPAEQRDFRNQLGDVWFLLATLLGHRNVETTRSVYLEPFQALQVEQLVALMDADDRNALEKLVSTLAADQPRVLTVST